MSPECPLDSYPHADCCSQIAGSLQEWQLSVFPGLRGYWLACTKGLTKCASSESFALEETPLSFASVCRLYHRCASITEKRARLNLDSGLPCAQGAVPSLIPLLVGPGIGGCTAAVALSLVTRGKNFKELNA